MPVIAPGGRMPFLHKALCVCVVSILIIERRFGFVNAAAIGNGTGKECFTKSDTLPDWHRLLHTVVLHLKKRA